MTRRIVAWLLLALFVVGCWKAYGAFKNPWSAVTPSALAITAVMPQIKPCAEDCK